LMQNLDSKNKKLFLKLSHEDIEVEVSKILKEAGYLNQKECWQIPGDWGNLNWIPDLIPT